MSYVDLNLLWATIGGLIGGLLGAGIAVICMMVMGKK